jgi:hypothetical protein
MHRPHISILRLVVLLLLVLIAGASCVTPPGMSAEGCTAFCVANGKRVESYRVGAAIPIFQPSPRYSCECEVLPNEPTRQVTP